MFLTPSEKGKVQRLSVFPKAAEESRDCYDLVFDVPDSVSSLNFPFYIKDMETWSLLLRGIQAKTFCINGTYNAGKTFVLGRLIGSKMRGESLAERTKALSCKIVKKNEKDCYLVCYDCAGTSTPAKLYDENCLLEKFATERFLFSLSVEISDFVILVFDQNSWQNTITIMHHARWIHRHNISSRKTGGRNKGLIIVFNYKSAKSRVVLDALIRQEIHETYLQSSGVMQWSNTGEPEFFSMDETKTTVAGAIYWFGDDTFKELKEYNDRVAQRILNKMEQNSVYRDYHIVEEITRRLGVDFKPENRPLVADYLEETPKDITLTKPEPSNPADSAEGYSLVAYIKSSAKDVRTRGELKDNKGLYVYRDNIVEEEIMSNPKANIQVRRFIFGGGMRVMASPDEQIECDGFYYCPIMRNFQFRLDIKRSSLFEDLKIGRSSAYVTDRPANLKYILDENFIVKTADYYDNELLVWCLQVDINGNITEDSEKSFNETRAKLLHKRGLIKEGFEPPCETLNVWSPPKEK